VPWMDRQHPIFGKRFEFFRRTSQLSRCRSCR
jgi:hypothetical protein